MDRQSGTILFERNANDRRYPASTAKLMTAMTARTVYQADDVVEVSATARAVEGTAIGIQAGEHYRVRDLLAASLIPSANDAAQALADHYREGNEGFLQHMNAYALHLHLSDSHFANASGLDSPQQYVTARDLGILAHEVMKDELLRTIVGTRTLVLHDLDQRRRFSFTNTHELLGVLPGVIGVKTGTTQSAGENLITDIQRNGHDVLLVVLGSRDRYRETRALVDWVFSAYRWEVVSFDEMAPQALQ
jgi:D-alanyl-D-alanine carboxypeptidase